MTGAANTATMTAPYDAVILDLDGVVTDTASTHAAAWKELFDEVLADPRAGAIAPWSRSTLWRTTATTSMVAGGRTA